MLQSSIFLSILYSQCFEDNSIIKVDFLFFDKNFQYKCFFTKKNIDNKYLELRDQYLFINDKIISNIVNFHIL